MKSKFLIIGALFFSGIVSGQKNMNDTIPPGIPTKKQMETEKKNHDCINRQNKSFTSRLKNYPFNKASQIKLVSFLQKLDKVNGDNQNKFSELPKLNDTICYSKLYEVRTLSITEVDTLTDILYNVGFRGPVLRESEMSCYEPRNAILFIDKNGQTFEYIEICFECEKTTLSSDKIIVGDICNQKFGLIKKFFRKAGIIHGTSEEK
jgi:hypothetical protein